MPWQNPQAYRDNAVDRLWLSLQALLSMQWCQLQTGLPFITRIWLLVPIALLGSGVKGTQSCPCSHVIITYNSVCQSSKWVCSEDQKVEISSARILGEGLRRQRWTDGHCRQCQLERGAMEGLPWRGARSGSPRKGRAADQHKVGQYLLLILALGPSCFSTK